MKTSFFVAVHTGEQCTEELYNDQSEIMNSLLCGILTDIDKIGVLTKQAALSSCHSEVSVCFSDGSVLGRAVVDMESDARVTLDKAKLSSFVKAAAPWKDVKVEKRLVPEAC